MSTIYSRIIKGEFKNNKPWSDTNGDIRQAHRDEERRMNANFRAALEAELAEGNWTQDVKDELWRQAWEHGHANGLNDVAGWYGELLDLARIAFNAGRHAIG